MNTTHKPLIRWLARTADGRRFYLDSEEQARRFATRAGGTYGGKAEVPLDGIFGERLANIIRNGRAR